MSPSKISILELSKLAAGVAVAGTLFLRGWTSPLNGQITRFDEFDYVPPSPAPTFVVTQSAAIPTLTHPYAVPRAAATLPLSTTPAAPVRAKPQTTSAPPASRRHFTAAINSSKSNLAASVTPRQSTAVGATANHKVTPLGSVSTAGGITPATHIDLVPSEQPTATALEPNRLNFIRKPVKEPPLPVQTPSFPLDRNSPPSIVGRHLGMQPGETASERSFRLMSVIGELERHVENVTFENATLKAAVKESDDKFQMAAREVRAHRKDLLVSREELDRLKREVDGLREKFRNVERDNAAVLQTMAPLLQHLLESDEIGALPTERAE